jgi:beta-glucosidase-like glycosyl hydrolase
VLFAGTLLPAIACAADMRQMSEREMACCKHMAGKCDMGTGEHSCCDQTMHSQDPARAVFTQAFQLQNTMQVSDLVVPANVGNPLGAHVEVKSNDGSPPESPPASITILRI